MNFRHLIHRAIGKLRENRNRRRSVAEIFQDIYEQKLWGDKESVSGTGSKLAQTEKVVAFIPEIIRQYDIRSILDIPCGDFNWMKMVNLDKVKYIGADIINEIVVANARDFETSMRTFIRADLIETPLPKTDMILCRDCLVHFSYLHIARAIQNIKASGTTFLLTTTFPEHENEDIVTGNWRPLNLQKPPFNLSEPLAILNEGFQKPESGNADKSLALWRISDLP
jgi:hypothetical protein